MKKILAMFLAAVLLLSAAAIAEDPGIDLSGLSFEQLVALRDQINLAIWNSQEWQEVTVPEGTYQVGKDIPAGHWSIRVAGEFDLFNVCYFDILNDLKKGPGPGSSLFLVTIATPGYSGFGEVNATETDIDMQNGFYFRCDGAVIFTPYTGKPDLGFK